MLSYLLDKHKAPDPNSDDFSDNLPLVDYKNQNAFISKSNPHFKKSNNLDNTILKIILADDYMKQGRVSESYALLGNAFEKFNDASSSSKFSYLNFTKKPFSENEKDKIIESINNSIGKRAIRSARRLKGRDPKLYKAFLSLAKDSLDKSGSTIGIMKKQSLLEKVMVISASGFLIISLFFLSNNFTGNILGTSTKTPLNFAGIFLFILGLVGLFIYDKQRIK